MVPNGAVIPKEYIAEEGKIVDAQLAMGGLRLAQILNQILGPGTQPAEPAIVPAAAPAPR